MQKPKPKISFHGTFALKKEDVLKVLNVALEEGNLGSHENLQLRTGLGNQKVSPIRSWATRSGLISGGQLSPEGEIILRHDPNLNSLVTDWLMHFHISFGDKDFSAGNKKLPTPPTNPAEWGGWTWFVYKFVPRYTTFTLEELGQTSTAIFDDNLRNLTKNFKILLRAYTEPHALKGCQYITISGDQYSTQHPDLPNPRLIGYCLAKLWQRDYPGQTSQLTETILNQPYGLAPVLGLSPNQLQPHLNQLETYGIISQRREVSPFQIIPRWSDPLELLDQAYQA
ncbi:MAG: DUF4007 family protein [Spirulinaceae cyanobacterium SM2_1_0]|nr:DUF4007 family protein [Spirulinaceae cyanobacterium SM2_1_0]